MEIPHNVHDLFVFVSMILQESDWDDSNLFIWLIDNR